MGAAVVVGDVRTYCNMRSSIRAIKGTMTSGKNLDRAVLSAIDRNMEESQVNLSSTVRLSIKCVNLPNIDTTRSDRMAVISKQERYSWHEIGMTEIIKDN